MNSGYNYRDFNCERKTWKKDVDRRIILRWMFRKLEGVMGTGWSWLRIGMGGGHL
jgi:hypothetical protein